MYTECNPSCYAPALQSMTSNAVDPKILAILALGIFVGGLIVSELQKPQTPSNPLPLQNRVSVEQREAPVRRVTTITKTKTPLFASTDALDVSLALLFPFFFLAPPQRTFVSCERRCITPFEAVRRDIDRTFARVRSDLNRHCW